MGELNWVHTAIVLLGFSSLAYLMHLLRNRPVFREAGWGAMLLSFICLCVSLVLRSQKAEYFALSNMYESLLMLSICTQLGFLIVDRWFSIRALGLPVALLVMGAMIYDLTLPTQVAPLQPALQSYWRSIHVPVILLSYALFTLAFLSSLVFLVKDYFFTPRENPSPGGGGRLATAGGPPLAMMQEHTPVLELEIDLLEDKANIYDEITYRCVAFAFPLLTIGIILGGLWANEAWGNYWSWDPKESMSLVTLLAYGVYLHMRVNGEHSLRALAWTSVAGFVMMLVTYFGVNLMGLGLHSYGKIG